jgi:pSer/pThr/pTyr-binding forkhead associated (FHA) protein
LTAPDANPNARSGSELESVLEAEREGEPFLTLRGEDGHLLVVRLAAFREAVNVGRLGGNDIVLSWDDQVSRTHARLEWVATGWTVVDDGLSTNGTFVNEQRVAGRVRLNDGDTLRMGRTPLVFRAPEQHEIRRTLPANELVATAKRLTDTQRRVVIALCRPYREPGAFAKPATNQEIADEVFLSVDAVKTHLRALFAKLGVGDLPHNQKRLRLVEAAFQLGVVSERDLR